MDRVVFPAKLAGSTVLLPFDFSSQLAAGETVSSASTTAAAWSGTDPSPSIISSTSVSGNIASVKVTGGVLGVTYVLLCTAVTSLGQTIQLSAYLAVTPNAA